LAAALAGHLLDPSPIDADTAEGLARDYDHGLRARLGISDLASLLR
jgi:hypothetical protein